MEAKKKEAQARPASERMFSIRKLRENCTAALGVSLSTFDGVFAGRSDAITLKQAKDAISEWESKRLPVGPMEVR